MRELYTASELARRLSVHPDTLRRLGREGKLERVKVGRSVRFLMPGKEKRNDKREIKEEGGLL